MEFSDVSFEIREQDSPVHGWVIFARMPDGSEEQLLGVYTEEDAARRWIAANATSWLWQRNARRR
jgi:hypothetical protein